MNNLLKFLLILYLLHFVACTPNELWKQPTELVFSIGINPQGSTGGPGDLTFNEGHIMLANIRLEGELENGEKFSYIRDFPNGLMISFLGTAPITQLKFAVPQGSYKSLKIYFDTYSASTTEDIYVEGIFVYNNPNKPPSTVKLEIETVKQFEVNVADEQGNLSFNLIEGNFQNPQIVLDPPYWFKNITASIMNGSNTTIVGGQSIITINSTTNSSIFANVDAEVGKNTKSVIKKK